LEIVDLLIWVDGEDWIGCVSRVAGWSSVLGKQVCLVTTRLYYQSLSSHGGMLMPRPTRIVGVHGMMNDTRYGRVVYMYAE